MFSIKNNTIIISPSGNFYGSEQVLFDFLMHTHKKYCVYIPKNSILLNKLNRSIHVIKGFDSLYLLYYKLFIHLLFKNIKLYVNEGGHIKYIKLLAKIFPKQQFVLQIRLLDDTNSKRLNKLSKNIQIVCVSKFIAQNIPKKYAPLVINDPFELPKKLINFEKKQIAEFTIGFIGRVTPTKGLKDISILLHHLEQTRNRFNIFFFGTIENEKKEVKTFVKNCSSFKSIKVTFKGFVDKKDEIYKNLNLVIHLNKEEAFPRIALESWAYGVPVIGFNAGGLGEINTILHAKEFLLSSKENWLNDASNIIQSVKKEYPKDKIMTVQSIIKNKLNINTFTQKLERLICVNSK